MVGVMWNVNGLNKMGEYIKEIIEKVDPDVVLLSETKRSRIIDISTDIACNPQTHRVIQLNATSAHRGGLIMILKTELRVETVELIRPFDDNDFIQGIVIEDKGGNAIIGLYCAPTLSTEKFGEVMNRLLTTYKVTLMLDDLNERHPAWCRKHDDKKRGLQLIREVQKADGQRIHAARRTSFQAPRYRNRGTFGSSNIDLLIAQVPIEKMSRMEDRLAERSDHFPVWFRAAWRIQRGETPRRIPKTLLKSKQMKVAVGEVYSVSLKEATERLDKILVNNGTQRAVTPSLVPAIQEAYAEAHRAITNPWEAQVKKRRRGSGPHVNNELLRLWAKKKRCYDRWKWRSTESNKRSYKEACRHAQRRERQLIKEQQRRSIQRIQGNPQSEVAKALKASGRRRQRQQQMERATGKQLRPREFAEYLAKKLDGPQQGLAIQTFTVDEKQFFSDVQEAIRMMEPNKAIGNDGVHVEMLKSNPVAAAKLLTKIWQVAGSSGQIPPDWLNGIIVPLYKGKGEQNIPANSRPLCILSHVRKLIEKAVVMELDRRFVTDKAQYGFQQGIQVTQAALSVLAAISKGVEFVVVLDLAKAYDNVQKLLMEVQAKVTGDISHTIINMLRGLTQGGTSSPALFRVFINSLPQEVRQGLQDAGLLADGTDPIRLVADDVIGLAQSIDGLQKLLDICAEWAARNGLNWNPGKSQVLRVRSTCTTQDMEVTLNGDVLRITDAVEYLGLILTKHGFKGKDKKELLEKCTGAIQMLVNEPWFNLGLHPKHIAQAYRTYVRSILLYGAELLNVEDRDPLFELDAKMIGILIGKLLKLGRGGLSVKHRVRLQLALGITCLEMDLNDLVRSRIDTWLERRANGAPKVSYHACESIENVQCLRDDHPLHQYLLNKARETTADWKDHKRKGWVKMLASCTGAGQNSGNRQIVSSATGLSDTPRRQVENALEYRDMAAELKKAMLRWSVYKFPVRHKPTEQEEQILAELPRWHELTPERKMLVRETLLSIHNAEQSRWGMSTLTTAGAIDIRSQTKINGNRQ